MKGKSEVIFSTAVMILFYYPQKYCLINFRGFNVPPHSFRTIKLVALMWSLPCRFARMSCCFYW